MPCARSADDKKCGARFESYIKKVYVHDGYNGHKYHKQQVFKPVAHGKHRAVYAYRPAEQRGEYYLSVAAVRGLSVVALVVAGAILPAGPRALLLGLNGAVSQTIPEALSGLLVFPTPFGGAFRGDFALAACILLVLDWVLSRASVSLRRAA